jgi:hypothetical protein
MPKLIRSSGLVRLVPSMYPAPTPICSPPVKKYKKTSGVIYIIERLKNKRQGVELRVEGEKRGELIRLKCEPVLCTL